VSRPSGRAQRLLADLLLAASLLAVAGLTLLPTPVPPGQGGPRIVVLGSLADLLRNVLLFVPLGVAFAWRGVSLRAACGIGFALAAAIELAQLAIPGRATSPDDALANALGAGLGHAWLTSAPRWLRPAAATARRLELAAGLLFTATLLLTAALTRPALPGGPWYAHWNPSFETLVPYAGPVRDARLAAASLPHGPLAAAGAARAALLAGETLRVRLEPRGPADAGGAVFLLSDARDREVALLGFEGDALVWRVRSRARALGLEPALLRAAGLGPGPEGRGEIALSVEGDGPAVCLARDDRRVCGLGFSAASGWTLLLPVLAFPVSAEPAIDLAWLALLALPIGLWWRPDWTSALAACAAGATLALAPFCGGLLPTPLVQGVAAAAGWGVGLLLGRWRPAA
jgi:VanZ family protein